MLLRWRATKEGGEFGSPKEPVGLLRSLQQNSTPVPAEQLAALSNVTGVSADVASSIIYMIRANACEVHRGGKRAGCALSALMGWHNHDCKPCATAAVSADGVLRVEALREIAEGEEVTISYVDTSKVLFTARAILGAILGAIRGSLRNCSDAYPSASAVRGAPRAAARALRLRLPLRALRPRAAPRPQGAHSQPLSGGPGPDRAAARRV